MIIKDMRKLLFPVVVLSVFAGCRPEPDNMKLLDELVVSTNYDTDVNFSGYTTYAMSTDTIGYVSDTDPNDTILVQSSQVNYPRPVLQRVESNMNALGYTRVDRDETPDIGINVYVVENLNLFQQVVYPGYYYPGYWGYNSYYYYPYVNTYAYNTGALVVEIVDLKSVTPDLKVKVVWNAYMGDVFSTIDLVQQSVDAIDQAFVQSPYLGK
jgi:hypothetical protein